jgi:tRNA pseudouridine32 synthase / 23S rRNA pseudouridine746 synthase
MVVSAAIVKYASILFVILENNLTDRFHRCFHISQKAKTVDFLAECCQLPKGRIKNVLSKGGVWLKKPHRKEVRLRKSTHLLEPGDKLDCYYDSRILEETPPSPQLLHKTKDYSAWFKPALLLTQGTRYGDHCSLLRFVEKFYNSRKDIKLIHRLDREAFGIVILGHNRKGAAGLSLLFQTGDIEKRYKAEVHGKMGNIGDIFVLNSPLDEKDAKTEVEILSYSPENNTSLLDIRLHTGRFHQIRRHLQLEGFPVIGDNKYGETRKGTENGLKLCAYKLAFSCPISGQTRNYVIDSF